VELYTDTDAPAIDIGVLKRLKRLDPRLRITFSRYAINYLTSRPSMIHNWDYDTCPDSSTRIHRRNGAAYLLDPAYHLWSQGGDGRWRHVQAYPAEGGFTDRHVKALEGDVARRFTISEILDRRERARQAAKEKAERDHKEERRDILNANQSRIRDLLDGKTGTRQAKIMSYGGQGKRGTPGTVRMDDREDGWEKPEPKSQ